MLNSRFFFPDRPATSGPARLIAALLRVLLMAGALVFAFFLALALLALALGSLLMAWLTGRRPRLAAQWQSRWQKGWQRWPGGSPRKSPITPPGHPAPGPADQAQGSAVQDVSWRDVPPSS